MSQQYTTDLLQIADTYVSCDYAKNFLLENSANLCVYFHRDHNLQEAAYQCVLKPAAEKVTNFFLDFWKEDPNQPLNDQTPLIFAAPQNTLYARADRPISDSEFISTLTTALTQGLGPLATMRNTVEEFVREGIFSLGNYEEASSIIEYQSHIEMSTFNKECASVWNTNVTTTVFKEYTSPAHVLVSRVLNNRMGHIKSNWVDLSNGSYCSKNPTNIYSCKRVTQKSTHNGDGVQVWVDGIIDGSVGYTEEFGFDVLKLFVQLHEATERRAPKVRKYSEVSR